jgi:hypothetical protein
MKKCENCGSAHDGKYGSGRFCSAKCSRGFSTKEKRQQINQKVSEKLRNPEIELECKYCLVKFKRPFKRRNQEYCSQRCSSKFKGWGNHSSVKWSEIHKKAYANGRNRVAGGTTKWFSYCDIKVQGSYELKACQKLDILKNNSEIKNWFYSRDRFKYLDKYGIERTYIVDFTIICNDDTIKFIEVKGRETEVDYIKWNTVRGLGHSIDIWRKEDLF